MLNLLLFASFTTLFINEVSAESKDADPPDAKEVHEHNTDGAGGFGSHSGAKAEEKDDGGERENPVKERGMFLQDRQQC